jgi:hypothetical protein
MATVLDSIVAGVQKSITLPENAEGNLESGYIPPDTTNRIIVSGGSYGDGPTVVLFDQFIGEDGASAFRTPDVGTWDNVSSYGSGTPKLYYDDTATTAPRTWLACRDPAQVGNTPKSLQALFKYFGNFTQFRFAKRAWVPTNRNFPAATSNGVMPAASSWKMTWFGKANGSLNELQGTSIPDRNVCIPSHIGSGVISIAGNSNDPKYLDGTPKLFYGDFSFTAPTFYTWYQSGAGTYNVFDQVGEFISVNDQASTREVRANTDPFHPFDATDEAAFNTRNYDSVRFPGWFGGATADDYTNDFPLAADFYMAIGANSRACIIISDSATFPTGTTEAYIMYPESWQSSEIEFWVDTHNDLGENLHVHIIKADGTLLQDVDYVRG